MFTKTSNADCQRSHKGPFTIRDGGYLKLKKILFGFTNKLQRA